LDPTFLFERNTVQHGKEEEAWHTVLVGEGCANKQKQRRPQPVEVQRIAAFHLDPILLSKPAPHSGSTQMPADNMVRGHRKRVPGSIS
jgi:hypothetical protein